jgi:hypothetical protein
MKIHHSMNPLHSIRQLEAREAKKADLPREMTPEVVESQPPDISALLRQSPLLNDLQGFLDSVGKATPPTRKELIDYSVDRIVEKHLSPGTLTEKDRREMRDSIAEFIQRDPQLSRKFDSILQRLSTLNGLTPGA